MPSRRPPSAFTIVELLVVVSIIVLLIALLMPALKNARYNAQRALCVANTQGQYAPQVAYALDHANRFAPHDDHSPDYHRSLGSRDSIVVKFRDRYLTNTMLLVCPLTAQVPSQPYREYADPGWHTPSFSYGGWDTDSANVYTAYMWLANYRTINGDRPLFTLYDEAPWPNHLADADSGRAFITHRTSVHSIATHDISHGGYGLVAPYFLELTPDTTVGFADGHAIIRPRADIRARVNISHGGTGDYYY